MSMKFKYNTKNETETDLSVSDDVNVELKKHSWFPLVNILDAEKMLSNKPVFTYLIRPADLGRGFAISFVQADNSIKHDHFTLVNAKLSHWRNGLPEHFGKLEKVIYDMMDCPIGSGQPF